MDSNFLSIELLLMKLLADPSMQRLMTIMRNYYGLFVRHLAFFIQLAVAGGWWLVLICCERKILLGVWWLVLIWCERKALLLVVSRIECL